MAPLGNAVANQNILGTGGVDDLIMIQDFGVTTTPAGALALLGGPIASHPQVPLPPIPPIPAPAVIPRSAFELHSAIRLKPANDTATALTIAGDLARGALGFGDAVQAVLDNGDFETADTKTKYTNTMTRIVELLPVVGEDPSGNPPPEASGVPRLRLIQEFHDNTGKPRWVFELRMRVELTADDYAKVQGFLAANSLPDAKKQLVTSLTVTASLDPRVQASKGAFDAVIQIV
jgi:hypothetical protein